MRAVARCQPRNSTPLPDWSPTDTAWLAGLMEGEGCFSERAQARITLPTIVLAMTDRDVMERAACLLGGATVRDARAPKAPHHKQLWQLAVSGARAVEAMKRLLPLMGERRSGKITHLIDQYYTDRPHLEAT